MNNRRIWFRLGGVLAAAAVCTGGAAVVSDRAKEAKNVQRAFLGAMETQMQIGCYPSETGSPADLTERERTELQTAYTSRVEQYYTDLRQSGAGIFGGAAGQSGYHHCDYEEGERRVETGLD